MDARHQDNTPTWLFGLAAAVVILAMICITMLGQLTAQHRPPTASRAPAKWPTLGPAPAAPMVANRVPSRETSGAERIGVWLSSSLDLPSPEPPLSFPLADSADETYDPIVNLAPLDLLKPTRLLLASEQATAEPDLSNLVLSPLDFDFGPTDLIVLSPSPARWSATSHAERWHVFGLPTDRLTQNVGQAIASLSNQGQVQLAKVFGTTSQLAARPQPRLARAKPRLTEGVILSPPALAGPVVQSSRDRLAMIPPQRPSQPDSNGALATPATLLEQIRLLIEEPTTSGWALQVEATLDAALAVRPGDTQGFALVNQNLRRLALEGSDLAEIVDTQRTAVLLRRACYGIFRRLAAWDLTVKIDWPSRRLPTLLPIGNPPAPPLFTSETWRLGTGAARERTSDSLAALRFALRAEHPQVWRSAVPHRTPSVATVRAVNAASLASRIEAYESRPSLRLASAIADDLHTLREAGSLEQQLAEQVEGQYHNANLRIAISDELLARLLPSTSQRTTPLRDRFLGADVRGTASTTTRLDIRLTPDDTHWRLGVEARGQVATRSTSATGPVTLHSRGITDFVAFKPLKVDSNGVTSAAAQCEANNRTRLVGIDSHLDALPVVRKIVRRRAEDQFMASHRLARRHAEQRVEQQVARELDTQASAAIERLRQQYLVQVVSRAEELGMQVEPVEVRTTDRRLIARLRLASPQQLGSHTPRTRAPNDSLASLQLHESALNNAAAGLDLAGQRFTPKSLREHLSARLNAPAIAQREIDTPEGELTFADEQPIRVQLSEGQARIVLALAEIRLGRKRYRNFKVHATYEPAPEGAAVRLQRVGTIQIEGRMKTASRLRLHGMFGQVLSDQHPLTLLAPAAGDGRFDDLMITQMVMADGWLGVALGPEQHPGIRGERVAVAGRYVR